LYLNKDVDVVCGEWKYDEYEGRRSIYDNSRDVT
jgi:hypothetical protein